MTALRAILGGIVAAVVGTVGLADAPERSLRPELRPDPGVVADAFLSTSGLRVQPMQVAPLRPVARSEVIPDVLWSDDDWTRAALDAIDDNRTDLSDIVPRDIALWCPAYEGNPEADRDAFWVGMMSALARHESTWNPRAVGGGGQWFGLLQISPGTARHYGCEATSGEALRDAEANLACAARIMSVTVARDEAVALHDGRWRGVAADWGPMTNAGKRAEMSAWTRAQPFCTLDTAVYTAPRPPARPGSIEPEVLRLAMLQD